MVLARTPPPRPVRALSDDSSLQISERKSYETRKGRDRNFERKRGFRGKAFCIPNGNKPRRCPEPVRRRHAATVEKDAISRANQTPRASSRRRHTASRVATSRCPPTSAISPRRRKVRARRGHPERGAPCARAVRTRRIHDEARFPRAFSPSSPRPFRRPR